MKIMKKLFLLAVFFVFGLFISSCEFSASDSKKTDPVFNDYGQAVECLVSGSVEFNGAVPDLKSNLSDTRSAIPEIMSSFRFKARAVCGDIEITSDWFSLGEAYFLKVLSDGTYKYNIYIEGYASEDSSELVLSGKKEEVLVNGNTSVEKITVYPDGESGYGTVALYIKVSSTEIASINAKWDEYSWSSNESEVFFDMKTTDEKVPSGSYEVNFYFCNTEGRTLYSCYQTINVFNNMTTSVWVDPNAEFIKDSGTGSSIMEVDDACISHFGQKYFYVDGTIAAASEQNGTYFNPYRTVQQAVNVIQSVNDGGEYTIYLLSDVSAGNGSSDEEGFYNSVLEGDSYIAINSAKSLKLTLTTLDGSNKTINANRSSENIGRVLYVSGSADVTIKNVTITGGHLKKQSYALSGAGIYTWGSTVRLGKGTIVSGNKIEDVCFGAGIYSNSSNFEMMDDCKITDNKCIGTGRCPGIYFTRTKEINIHGGKIFNNSSESINGGGIALIGNTEAHISEAHISNCEIYNNSAKSGSGIYCCYGNIYLSDGAYVHDNTGDNGSGVEIDCSSLSDNKYNFLDLSGSAYISPENEIKLANSSSSTGRGYIKISEVLTSTYSNKMKVNIPEYKIGDDVFKSDSLEKFNSANTRFEISDSEILTACKDNNLNIYAIKNIYVSKDDKKTLVLGKSDGIGIETSPLDSVQAAIDLAESFYKFENDNSIAHYSFSIIVDGTETNTVAGDADNKYSALIAGKANACKINIRGYSASAPGVLNADSSDAKNLKIRNLYVCDGSSVTLGENLTLKNGSLPENSFKNPNYGRAVYVDNISDITLKDNVQFEGNVHVSANSIGLSNLSGYRFGISLGSYNIGDQIVKSGATEENCTLLEIYTGYGDKKSSSLSISADGKLSGTKDVSVYEGRLGLPNIRVGQKAAGDQIIVRVLSSDPERWYESEDGNSWTEITAYKNDYKCVYTLPELGKVKYIKQTYTNLFGVEEAGIVAKLECDSKYDAIGQIYYSDKTYGSTLDAAKTPVGIVLDADETGVPKKIVYLNEEKKLWASDDSFAVSGDSGQGISFGETSYDDGSGNWDIIKNYSGNDVSTGKYPAFDYCNEIPTASWYLPANYELEQMAANLTALNEGLSKISGAAVFDANNSYLSSRSRKRKQCYVKQIGSTASPKNNYIKFYDYNYNNGTPAYFVRPVAKVESVLPYENAVNFDTFANADNHLKDGVVNYEKTPDEFTSAATAPTLLIYTAEELRGVSKWTEKAGSPIYGTFILKNDIDLGGVAGDDSTYFTPICFKKAFKGTFDGQGHTVSNMIVDNLDSSSYAGFIGLINGATVKNVIVKGVVKGMNSSGTGGVVASSTGTKSTITDCVNYAKVTSTATCTGGILGFAAYPVDIRNCINIGEINGKDTVGGIATRSSTSALVIMNCANIGKVNANSNVGGIAPDVQCIKNCYNAGKVTSASGGNTGGSILNSVSNISEEKYYLKCYYLKDSYIYNGNNYAISAGTDGKDSWLLTGMFDTELKLEGDTTSLRDALNTGIASFATEEYKTPWDYTYSKDGVSYPVCVPVE